MCDTLGLITEGVSIFGKNSDRDFNEVQVAEWYGKKSDDTSKVKCSYIEVDQVKNRNGVLLSRPEWLWGGEMGVNDKGVIIGNEALFTKNKSCQYGLTGMDLIRLSLERSSTSKEALDNIIALLNKYGQGGNCGFNEPLYYDNAFLIMDSREIYVLETCGKEWVYTKKNPSCISNLIQTTDNGDIYSDEVKDFSILMDYSKTESFGGFNRLAQTRKNIKSVKSVSDMMKALRIHEDEFDLYLNNGSVRSTCMHRGEYSKSQTTSSIVVEISDLTVAWLSGGSMPCLSMYKPFVINDSGKDETIFSKEYWLRHNEYVSELALKKIPKDYYIERDNIELKWIKVIKKNKHDIKVNDFLEDCLNEEQKFMDKWRKIL